MVRIIDIRLKENLNMELKDYLLEVLNRYDWIRKDEDCEMYHRLTNDMLPGYELKDLSIIHSKSFDTGKTHDHAKVKVKDAAGKLHVLEFNRFLQK